MAVRKVPVPKKPGGVKRPGTPGPKPYPMPRIIPDSKKPGGIKRPTPPNNSGPGKPGQVVKHTRKGAK